MADKLREIRKAVVAVLTAVTVIVPQALDIINEWGTGIVAVIGAILVYLVPNDAEATAP